MRPYFQIPRTMARAWRAQLAPLLIAAFGCGLPAAIHAQTNYQRLISFRSTPPNSLIEGSDGKVYGTTYSGGSSSRGSVFKLNKDGSGFTMLRSFGGSGSDGGNPQAALVEGSDRALYGTTSQGGTTDEGTVFKLNKDGSGYKVLHHFSYDGGRDPLAGLVAGSDQALYGTTYQGGKNDGGTVFKLNEDGTGFRVLHSFPDRGGDGSGPFASLLQGSDGALYGTTRGGGSHSGGAVFKLSKDGSSHSVLHSFNPEAGDGRYPESNLVEGSAGALYGTTSRGEPNAGTVFKLNKDGSGFTVLHRFQSSADFTGKDGWMPLGGLVVGNGGALYGATSAGGGSDSYGTLFKLLPDGSGYTVLHRFTGSFGDGIEPNGPALVKASDGALYGTTTGGGNKGAGILFKLLLPSSRPPPRLFALGQTGQPRSRVQPRCILVRFHYAARLQPVRP